MGWFVDENDLLLGRRLAETRDDVLHPGHPDLPEIPRGTPDDVWLQIVQARELIVITRDKRIRYRPVERLRWIEHGVRGFVLTRAGNLRISEQVALVDTHWNSMERYVAAHAHGPWMLSLTRHGIRPLIPPPPSS